METMQQAIERNRRTQARYRRAERILHAVRIRIFDYDDAGLYHKAEKVIAHCQRTLAPLWECQRKGAEERKYRNYMM